MYYTIYIAGTHYFSSNHSEEIQLKPISVRLLGKDYEFQSAEGVFSSNALDKGTAVLLDYIDSERGSAQIEELTAQIIDRPLNILDIGCGWGVISLFAALYFGAQHNLGQSDLSVVINAIDVNTHALEVTKLNAEQLGLSNIHTFTPDDLPQNKKYDLILSNPPIRIGKDNLLVILQQHLSNLSENSMALFLIQKNLGADTITKLLSDLGYTCDKLASSKGFRILKVTK